MDFHFLQAEVDLISLEISPYLFCAGSESSKNIPSVW